MSQFRGLTYQGIPLVFDKDPPERQDAGYLVFLTQKQFLKARKAGIELHWLRPCNEDDRAFFLIGSEPEST